MYYSCKTPISTLSVRTDGRLPSWFRSDTTFLMTGTNDVGPFMGYLLENVCMLWDKKARQFRLRTGHV